MLMVMTNDGKQRALDIFWGVGTSWNEDFYIELFKNDYTPVDGSVTADFDAATFTGYGPLFVPTNTFIAAIIAANIGISQLSPAPEWTCSGIGAQYVYGWFLRGVYTGKTYFAQRFDAPRLMDDGAVESLNPFYISSKSYA